MKISTPLLLYDIFNGLFGGISREYYKNKFVKQFSSFENFKRAVKFDKFRKYGDNYNKAKKLLTPYVTEQEAIIISKVFKVISQDDLQKIYEKYFSFCGKFYKMEKYQSHRDARGYYVYLWKSGHTYYRKNFKPEMNRLAYILKQIDESGMMQNGKLQSYLYCEVVFYKGWNLNTYLYLINNHQLKVGDLVVAPPHDDVAEIKKILECSYFDKPSSLQTNMPAITTLASKKQIAKKDEIQRRKDEINNRPIEKGTQYCRVVYEDIPMAKRYCYEVSEYILLQVGDYVYSPNGKKVKVVEVFRSEEVPKDLKNSYKIIRRFR